MIFLDTNVISEALRKSPHDGVISWLSRFDIELSLSTVALAELAYGVSKINPGQRSVRLEIGVAELRRRFAGRMFSFTEDAALAYGELMGNASRKGRGMEVADGMIAAIAIVSGGRLATRNMSHFETAGLTLINPWDH